MLVVDRLEALPLERNYDQAAPARLAARAQLRDVVGEALAIVEAGHRIGGCKDNRVVLLLNPELRFVLEIDVAPPAEQDQRNVQGQRCAGDTDLSPEIAYDAKMPKEGAAVPDEQHHCA